ncbi:tRNA dihydrouridine synthase [Fluviispira multicolorata]|uniref:tRNA-dihydrouridine synthase n=1 Tax=Fluviispira multicolorata TaxID=2654512 RepID=A0A833JEV8_9BACT|nr:tRNA-dihydrouridine synthase family protein [Fluviispira multicolorata]KAB8030674.1 tRNA-dihydrouridine synthase family protein [Fluviispira multicolorata]
MSENIPYELNTRFKKLGIDFPFMIAPMVGLSHVAFRELIKSYIPKNLNALRFTEMLSTRRIPNEKLETTNELKIAHNETYFIPQLLGNEEKFIAPSIEKLIDKNPWGFDINMGCPVSHTLKHNWGVRLMGSKDYASQIVRIVKKYSKIPVSVKLRGGIGEGEDFEYLYSFVSSLEDAGADFLTIHARTRAQKHSGDANWQLVADVRNKLKIPIIANGNIQTAQDAIELLRIYGVDGAMIARAATARPWILWQISELLGNEETPLGYEGFKAPCTPEEEGAEYIKACLKLISIMSDYFQNEEYILEKFRFFAATGARWFQFGHHFWRLTMKAKSVHQLRESIIDFGNSCENPMSTKIKMI